MGGVMQIATIKPNIYAKLKEKKVAAYARVSTSKDEAEDSLSNQVSYYNNYINGHYNWQYVGVYMDEGISGTKEQRPGFQQMMADAREGKFDILLTKSITRLARNTVTLLSTVRELRRLGIDVYFEKENMHAMGAEGEMMLTLLAMYAEMEAQSASDNKRWQIKRDFEKGIPTFFRIYGYRWKDGQLIMVPEEAKVVKRIYQLYLEGYGKQYIAEQMKKEYPRENRKWNAFTIMEILKNEKYKGDLLLQKTYRPDFRSKKKEMNKGQWRQYLVVGAHKAIISAETFDAVQEEIKRRQEKAIQDNEHNDNTEILFRGLIRCGCCGRHYIRKRNNSAKGKPYRYLCSAYASGGVKACPAQILPEETVIQKVKEVLGLPEKTPITATTIQEKIVEIVVMAGDKLKIVLKDGTNEVVTWKKRSRAESWTKEMRERARQKAKEALNKQHRATDRVVENFRKPAGLYAYVLEN